MSSMLKRCVSTILAVMLLLPIVPGSLSAFAAAEPPVLRVSNVLGRASDNVTVSVTMSENSYACGGNFNLVYDNTKLLLVSVSCGGLVSGMTPVVNPQYDSDKVRFTFAGITPVTDFGTLLTATFKILDGASGEAAITLEKVNLYDGNSNPIDKTIENGGVVIDGGVRSPCLSVGAYEVESEEEVTVDVDITALSQVCGGSFNIVYDNTRLAPVSAQSGGLTSGMSCFINTEYAEDTVRVSFSGITPITEAGSLVSLTFRVVCAESVETEIKLESTRIYDGDAVFLPHTYENGSVSINYIVHGTAKLSVQKASGCTGDSVSVAVQLRGSSSICGGNFTLKYDNEKLRFISAAVGELINGCTAYINPDYDTDKIRVVFSGTQALAQSGTVAVITFEITDEADGATGLSLSNARVYDDDAQPVELLCSEGFVDAINTGSLSGNYKYIIKDGVAAITAYTGTETSVVVPRSISGKTVTKISENAFINCSGIKEVIIPDSVNELADSAFAGCDNLTIYGYEGSAAEDYAEENGIEFIKLYKDIPGALTELTSLTDHGSDYIHGFVLHQTAENVAAQFNTRANVRIVSRTGAVMSGADAIGTGCKIQLMEGESVLDERTVIVFGDINGDGGIDSADVSALSRAASMLALLDDVSSFAADINGDGVIDSADVSSVSRAAALLTSIDQSAQWLTESKAGAADITDEDASASSAISSEKAPQEEVPLTWLQWLIKILLFGWIWY